MDVFEVMELAADNVEKAQMLSSAMLCLDDAIRISTAPGGNLVEAKARALKSLAYSIGVLHPDYIRASE